MLKVQLLKFAWGSRPDIAVWLFSTSEMLVVGARRVGTIEPLWFEAFWEIVALTWADFGNTWSLLSDRCFDGFSNISFICLTCALLADA